MTLLDFAEKRRIDWKEIFEYLKHCGNIDVIDDPLSTIGPEWFKELEIGFPIQEDNSEVEISGPPPTEILDEKTKQQIDAEANQILFNPKIDPSKVDIDAKNLTMDIVIRRLENNEIQLDPEFQRGANLWSPVRQSRLIESILIKLPLPAFYFDATNDNFWAVVDGLQRLSAIKNFVVDKTLHLTGLEFLPNLNDRSYDQLPRPIQRRIQETGLFVYLIKPGNPDDIKYNIFKRINTGGLVLNPQEIRHALNQGVPSRTLKEMAEMEEFRQATSYSIGVSRMTDRDYINRFVAFYFQDYKLYERGDEGLDGFLNEGLASINNANKDVLKRDFKESMIAAHSIFGADAFRKRYDYPPDKRRKPLNKALFEVWGVNLAKLTDESRKILIQVKEEVIKESIELLNSDGYFSVSITYATGDANRVKYRFQKIEELISKILKKYDK